MKAKNLLLKIADLMLVSDEGTASWVEVPVLRRLFYVICGITILIFAHILLGAGPFRDLMRSSESVTMYFRVIALILFSLLQTFFLLITAKYFSYVLSKNVAIRFSNVFNFYAISWIAFSLIYMYIWLLWPNMFNYLSPPISWSPILIESYWGLLKVRLDFMVLSALQSVNGSYYKIQYNGIIPSIVAWIQALYTLCLVALLVASYVNQKTANSGRKE